MREMIVLRIKIIMGHWLLRKRERKTCSFFGVKKCDLVKYSNFYVKLNEIIEFDEDLNSSFCLKSFKLRADLGQIYI